MSSSTSPFPTTERVKPDYSAIIRPTIQYELFNPRVQGVQFSFDGRPYNIPGVNERWKGRDPSTGEEITYPKPGVLPVWTPTAAPGRGRIEYNARDIVEFACGPDGISGSVGPLGIRPLFGDERDELVEEEALSAHAERKLIEAQDTIRKHESRVAAAKADGQPPPFPSHKVLEAYQTRQAIETNISFAAQCPVCNMGFRNPSAESQAQLHIIAWHKERTDLVEKARAATGMMGNTEEQSIPKAADIGLQQREIPRGLQGGAADKALDAAEAGSISAPAPLEGATSDPARQVEEQLRKGTATRAAAGNKPSQ